MKILPLETFFFFIFIFHYREIFLQFMNYFLKSKPFGILVAMGRASLAKVWYPDKAATAIQPTYPIETGDRLGSLWFSVSHDRFENIVSLGHIYPTSLSPVSILSEIPIFHWHCCLKTLLTARMPNGLDFRKLFMKMQLQKIDMLF